MLALKIALLCFAGLLDVIFSFLVLARDVRKVNNVSFFILAFSMGSWALGIAAFLGTSSPGTAFAWAKVYYLFPLLVAGALTIFTLSFPSKEVAKTWMVLVIAGLLALVVPLMLDRTFVTQRLVYYSWGKDIILNLKDYLLYSVYLLGGFSISLYIIYRKSKLLTGIYGTQALLFFTGFSIAAIFGVFFNLVLPGVGNYRLIWIGPLFTTVFIAIIAYSIIRHKMFDIRLVVARALGYASSLLVLASLYGFIVFGVANIIFKLHFSLLAQVFLSSTTGFAAIFFGRLRSNFDKATNKIFYRDAYDAQSLFDQLNRVLISTLELNQLLKRSTLLIAENLKAEYCLVGLKGNSNSIQIVGTETKSFNAEDIQLVRSLTPYVHSSVIATDYLEEKDEALKAILVKNNIAILVRLAPHLHKVEEGLGYLVLGVKKSGYPYNNKDFRVLDTISKELILAIQNAMRYEESKNFNVTLQEKIEQATRKLKGTNEKLRALDETKDDFISMASHQLRTPLTSIKGYISMVLEEDAGKITHKQRDMLGQAFISSQRMVYLIADLLNVSRLKTGKFVIEATPINLARLVEQEMAQLKETAASRSLTVSYEKPKTFPDLMLDETKTRQVIMNFVDNAIYYTPSGGHITVKLIDNPTSVELRVEDNGIGVPKHEQPHLFTKFYRAANARKARPDGTGLGLFMAKKVIVAQHGSLIFESKENEGSTFGFVFNKSQLAKPITS